jgi:hypothetical protein
MWMVVELSLPKVGAALMWMVVDTCQAAVVRFLSKTCHNKTVWIPVMPQVVTLRLFLYLKKVLMRF